jgi:hypothetical protein
MNKSAQFALHAASSKNRSNPSLPGPDFLAAAIPHRLGNLPERANQLLLEVAFVLL